MAKLPSLLDLISHTREVEAQFVAELSPQEREAPGAPDDWAAKDLLAHVTTWRERGVDDLESARRGPLPPEPEEFDEVNRAIYDQNQVQSWEVILRRAEASWNAFSKSLAELPEDLLLPGASSAQSGRPLWRRVTVDAGNHPVLHYAEHARRQGRTASATRWMAGLTPRLLAVDPSGEWHGVVHYNLACHYAQTGMPDRGLDSLQASLELNPGLKEWSRQDSDLLPLHGHPQFSAVVGSDT